MMDMQNHEDIQFAETAELRVVFQYQNDRWHHSIFARDRAKREIWQVVLESREGIPDQAVPASPAFQELRMEAISPDQHVFQLMGQAGSSIYSAAVLVDRKFGLIDFDLCMRGKPSDISPGAGSTYDLGDAWARKIGDAGATLELSRGAETLVIEAVSVEGSAAGRCEIVDVPQGAGVKVQAAGDSAQAGTLKLQSRRWRYRFRGAASA